MRRSRSVGVGTILVLTLLVAPGCSDPLARSKDLFAQGVAKADFSGRHLEELNQAVGKVISHKDRYGDEGIAQAATMLAYACVESGRLDQADTAIGQLELTTDGTKISMASQALLIIVMADSSYQRFLKLAAANMRANAAEMGTRIEAAVDAYEAAMSSGAFASQATLRQSFALREADILLSAGNLWTAWDPPRAKTSYSRALEITAEAGKRDAALRGQLLEQSIEAQKRIEATVNPGEPRSASEEKP